METKMMTYENFWFMSEIDEIFWWFFYRTNKKMILELKMKMLELGEDKSYIDYHIGILFMDWRDKLIDDDIEEEGVEMDCDWLNI
jgi:hypothetical protein